MALNINNMTPVEFYAFLRSLTLDGVTEWRRSAESRFTVIRAMPEAPNKRDLWERVVEEITCCMNVIIEKVMAGER